MAGNPDNTKLKGEVKPTWMVGVGPYIGKSC